MKKVSFIAAVAMLLALAVAPAAVADPGNGTGWEQASAVCDDGTVLDITGHEGLWSATHLQDGSGRLILTAQTITVEGVGVVLDLEHPGHKNQEPDYENCTFTLDGGVTISLTGFIRP